MRHTLRLARQSLATLWHAKLRTTLLIVLISMSTFIFVVIGAFSRASSDTLSDAVDSSLGAVGTYRLTLPTGLGMTSDELVRLVRESLTPLRPTRIAVADVVANIPADCPPFDVLGTPLVVVQRDADNTPVSLPFGSGLPDHTELCLSGLEVPASALYMPNAAEKAIWGEGTLFLDAAYEHEVRLAAGIPGHMQFIVVTGRAQDEQPQIKDLIGAALTRQMALQSVDAQELIVVNRVDSSPEIRAATDAVRAVYTGIGWGVLLLGGLGILVAQLIVIRDRSWFFGLARAVGATPRDVAVLVVAEVAIVVAVGLALALGLCVVLDPIVNQVGQDVLRVPLHLLDAALLPQVIGATIAVMAVGAAYPARRAARLDPLDVLERR